MSKYAPLRDHFLERKDSFFETSFEEISEIVTLPPSAFRYRGWWSNSRSEKNGQANAWLQAGWRTWGVDVVKKRLKFYRAAS